MTKHIIESDKAPAPIGPYNQAIVSGNFLFTSGQIPIDLNTGDICDGGIQEQTRLVLTHLTSILNEAGSSLDQVLKTTVFISDMNNFALMNEVYAEFFPSESAPARSCVEVARLPKDVLVEIEAVATIS